MTDHVARIQAQWHRERPDVDVAPQGVLGRLHRLARFLTEELVAVYDRYGLSEGEFDVLCALRRSGEPYQRQPADLAKTTMITTGAATKRLDRLEARGLLRRDPDPADARAKLVSLTPAGRRLIDAAFTEHMRNEARLVGQLAARDRAELERVLTTWLREFEQPD